MKRLFPGAFFFCYFLFCVPTSAQLLFKANAETGFNNSRGNSLNKGNNSLTRLETQLSYKYNQDNNSAIFQIKARPEFYGLDGDLTSFKFRGSAEFSRREASFNWGLSIFKHLNNISVSNTANINHDIFFFQADLTLFILNDLPIKSNLGYAYQSVNSEGKQEFDLLFGGAKVHQVFSSYFRTGYGFYIENFAIENKFTSDDQNTTESNKGYRFGPEVELYYLKDYIFNLRYRFLFHLSDQTNFLSYEQWIRLVTGKILFPRFSVFILVDYYLRKFKESGSSTGELPILYTPLNQENHISIKTGYDLTDKFEIYLKSSYSKEDLIYNNLSFEGWNFLLGIEFSN
ncbi:MAG: hypothetical protein PVH88_20775 [Ignavibacteria bacterium]|jgi:hypothetical protein